MRKRKSFWNRPGAAFLACAAAVLASAAAPVCAEEAPPDVKSVEEFSGELTTGQDVSNIVSFPFRMIAYAIYYPLKFILYDIWAWLWDLCFGSGEASESDYLGMLGEPDPARRIMGLRGLGGLKAASALDRMIDLFADPNDEVREEAVAAVGRIGSDSKSARLMDMAGGQSPWPVRASAILALGLLREKSATAMLMKTLEDPAWQIRCHALNALGAIGDTASGPAVSARLKDSEPLVRASAATALGNIGDPAGLPALLGVLDSIDKEGSAVRAYVVIAVGKLGGTAEAARIFAILKSPAFASDPVTRGTAAHVLGEMGYAAAEPELTAMLLSSRDDREISGAAQGLAMLGRLAPLVEAMKSESPYKRMAGALGAMRTRNPDALPHLLSLLSDPYSDVRRTAIIALLSLGSEEGVEALIGQLAASDLRMRAWALLSLQQISGKDFGLDAEAWLGWWRENADSTDLKSLFPEEPPRRKKLSRADRERSRAVWARAAREARAAG